MSGSAIAQTRISFAAGSDSGSWSGFVSGSKDFVLNLGKGQRLWVNSKELYTWYLVSPSGRRIGCNPKPDPFTNCAPGAQLTLPESGDYRLRTDYRMTGGANAPALSRRYVSVQFVAR
jgi:hypothetical protein